MRKLRFLGRSYDDLTSFPRAVQQRVGFQLKLIQLSEEPDDWKPMATVGPGVAEIRIRDNVGAFRVLYVAKFEEAVYVLHCFEKKTQKTSRQDLELAGQRYRKLVRDRKP